MSKKRYIPENTPYNYYKDGEAPEGWLPLSANSEGDVLPTVDVPPVVVSGSPRVGSVAWNDQHPVANTVLDFTPIVGDIKGLTYDPYMEYKRSGSLTNAAGMFGLGALGILPIAGDALKKGVTQGLKFARKAPNYRKYINAYRDELGIPFTPYGVERSQATLNNYAKDYISRKLNDRFVSDKKKYELLRDIKKKSYSGLGKPYDMAKDYEQHEMRNSAISDYMLKDKARERNKIRAVLLTPAVFPTAALGYAYYNQFPKEGNNFSSMVGVTSQPDWLAQKINNAMFYPSVRKVFPFIDNKYAFDINRRNLALTQQGYQPVRIPSTSNINIGETKYDPQNNAFYVENNLYKWNGLINLSDRKLYDISRSKEKPEGSRYLFNSFIPGTFDGNKYYGSKDEVGGDDDKLYGALEDGKFRIGHKSDFSDTSRLAYFPAQTTLPITKFGYDPESKQLKMYNKNGEYAPYADNNAWGYRKVVFGTPDGSATFMGTNLFTPGVGTQAMADTLNKRFSGKPIYAIVPDNGSYDEDGALGNSVRYPSSNKVMNVFVESPKGNGFKEGGPTDSIYSSLINRVNTSNADFVQRINDPSRITIPAWEDPYNSVATHKLGWTTDNKGNAVVFPSVQNINGKLVDFTRPPYSKWAAYDNAVQRGDTLMMKPNEAQWYTEHYKEYAPKGNGFKFGGSLKKLNNMINYNGILIGDPLDGESQNEYIQRAIREERQKAVNNLSKNVSSVNKSTGKPAGTVEKSFGNLIGNGYLGDIKNHFTFLGFNPTWRFLNSSDPVSSVAFKGSFGQIYTDDYPDPSTLSLNSILKSYGNTGMSPFIKKRFYNNPDKYGFQKTTNSSLPLGSIGLRNSGDDVTDAIMYLNNYKVGTGNPRIFKFSDNNSYYNNIPEYYNHGWEFEDHMYPAVYNHPGNELAKDINTNYIYVGTPKQIKRWTNQYNKYFEDKAASEEAAQQVAEHVIEQAPVVVPMQETRQVFQAPPSWYVSAYNGMKNKFPNMSDEGIHRTIMSARNMIGDDQYRQWRNQQWKNGGPIYNEWGEKQTSVTPSFNIGIRRTIGEDKQLKNARKEALLKKNEKERREIEEYQSEGEVRYKITNPGREISELSNELNNDGLFYKMWNRFNRNNPSMQLTKNNVYGYESQPAYFGVAPLRNKAYDLRFADIKNTESNTPFEYKITSSFNEPVRDSRFKTYVFGENDYTF